EADIRSASRTVSRSVYLAVLSKTEPSPFSPESDEEKPADAPRPDGAKPDPPPPEGAKPDAKPDAAPPEAAKPDPPRPPRVADVKIDFDKISQRILAMPMPARRYVQLQAGRAGTLFAIEAPTPGPAPGPGPGGPPAVTVHRYDLRQRRADVVASGVRFFEVSANGEKTLTARAERWSIQTLRPMPAASGTGGGPGASDAAPPAGPPSAGPAPGGPAGPGQLNTENIEVRSDPRAEWKQMYHDAWRIQREFFYDPALHGLDLAAAINKYEPYLESVMSRRDLSYVFADMMGEITVGHLGVGGGDVPETKNVATGLLGCDYRIENGRYRVRRCYNGENWNPDLRAPLTQPGVNVEEGEDLLAVNGRELGAADNVYSFFEATSGKQMRLRVGGNPDGSGAR
ncbi:MAG: PDZ domain-containing protein, partial [Planctomycetaceae bacterium]